MLVLLLTVVVGKAATTYVNLEDFSFGSRPLKPDEFKRRRHSAGEQARYVWAKQDLQTTAGTLLQRILKRMREDPAPDRSN